MLRTRKFWGVLAATICIAVGTGVGSGQPLGGGTIHLTESVRVIDGDTLETRIGDKLVGVGLLGIRAARGNTPCGELALALTQAQINVPGTRLEADSTFVLDGHKRRLYYALTGDGRSVARELVKAGLARSIGKGREASELAGVENDARTNNRGCINDFPEDKDTKKEQYVDGSEPFEDNTPPSSGDEDEAWRNARILPVVHVFGTTLRAAPPQALIAGVNEPTDIASLPDGRMLISEKGGRVLLVRDGTVAAVPFIDWRANVNAYGKHGLLGVAVDPNFSINSFVYLLYTYENDPADYSGTKTLQLLRVKASGDRASTLPGDTVPILGKAVGESCDLLPAGSDCIPVPNPNGQPAELRFGFDGALFLTVGGRTYVADSVALAATFAPIRVNAGGPSYTDPQGNVWAADTGFSAGRTYSVTTAIANTTTPVLYRSERFNTAPLTYTFAVPNGTYTVTLKFAEIYFTSPAQRVFNIVLNEQTVQTNFDVLAAAGGANRAIDRTYQVTVTNGQIAIRLTPVVQNPKINAIEIVADSPVNVSVSPSTVSKGPSQTQQFTASVTGTTNTAVTWSMTPMVGTISTSGLYTAPATIASQQTVTVKATSQADTSKSGSASVILTPPTSGGGGLLGQYFDNQDLTNLKVTRVDPTVDFNLASGASPDPQIAATTYSVRWTGRVRADFSQTYRFYTVSNDGVRLWVNNQLLVNNWTDHAATENSGTIALQAGQWYPIVLEFYQGAGTAQISLSYSSTGTPKQIIPSANLDPNTSTTGVNVSVSPASVTRRQGERQQFSASVTGSTNTAVTWSITPNVGTISATGLYAAPSTLTSQQTVMVTATSQADPTKSDSATLTLLAGTFSWSTKASSPIGRMEAQGGVANGKLYVFGGFTTSWTQVTTRADAYDAASDTWTRIADVPEPLTHSAVAVDGSTIFLIGGYVGGHPGPSSERVWKYDTVSNSWSAGPPLPGTRGGGAAARVGRFLYFFGGATRSAGIINDTDQPAAYRLALDGGTAWTGIADLPNPRNHIGGVAVNGKIYAIAGQHAHHEGPGNQVEVDMYDPASNVWTRVADLPLARGHLAVVELDGRILIMGNGPARPDVTLYDPVANVWLTMPPLPQARASAVAGVLNGAVIVTTGHSGNSVASTVTWSGVFPGKWETATQMPIAIGEVAGGIIGRSLYLVGEGNSSTLVQNLSTGTWTSGAAPGRPYVGHHHAAEVVNGKLYLLGGLGNGSEGRVQIYDPVANSWSLGANMPFAAGSSASAVINGEIIVAGGIIGSSSTAQAAAYNPTTNTWRTLASMPRGVNHAASATNGSRLYVFGGRTGGNVVANGENTVQVYDPASNTWSSNVTGAPLAPLPQARGGMGKAVYVNGEFYVIGGETLTGAGATTNRVYNRVDIYNPTNNSWRSGTPMPTARHGIFPVTVGGRIYVAGGGTVAGNSQSARSEVYNIE